MKSYSLFSFADCFDTADSPPPFAYSSMVLVPSCLMLAHEPMYFDRDVYARLIHAELA